MSADKTARLGDLADACDKMAAKLRDHSLKSLLRRAADLARENENQRQEILRLKMRIPAMEDERQFRGISLRTVQARPIPEGKQQGERL